MILINGQESQFLSAYDRGLAYGDGVFRTLAMHGGKLQCWTRHYAKLRDDCERLGLQAPSEERLRNECVRVSPAGERGVVKIIVTRGQGGRGYAIPQIAQPTCIVMGGPWPEYPPENEHLGIKARLCSIRLAEQPALAGIKHLNRLENVLARAEWSAPAIAEGLLLDAGGNLIEGVMSNLFMRNGNVLTTPDLSRCGVAGVTRQRILECADQTGMATEIRKITPEELLNADECLVCNSLIGVWQIRELESRKWAAPTITPIIRELLARHHD